MSTKPTHTSGPWTYRKTGADGRYAIESNLSDRKHLATEERVGVFETINEANAQLIASAPELLHVMILVRNYLAEIQTVSFHAGHKIALDSMNEVIDKAQAPG